MNSQQQADYQKDCADIARVSKLAEMLVDKEMPDDVRELADWYRMVARIAKEDISAEDEQPTTS